MKKQQKKIEKKVDQQIRTSENRIEELIKSKNRRRDRFDIEFKDRLDELNKNFGGRNDC